MEKLKDQELTSFAKMVRQMITCASHNWAKKFGGKWGMLDKFLAKSHWNGKKPFLPIFIHFLLFFIDFLYYFIALSIKPNTLIALWVWFFTDIATSKFEQRGASVFSFCCMYNYFLRFFRKNLELNLRSFSHSKIYENVTEYTFSHLFILVMVTWKQWTLRSIL